MYKHFITAVHIQLTEMTDCEKQTQQEMGFQQGNCNNAFLKGLDSYLQYFLLELV